MDRLSWLGQPHLAEDLKNWSSEEKHCFLSELQNWDRELLQSQQERLKISKLPLEKVESWKDFAQGPTLEDEERGRELVRQGKVGCIILAGGVGSRLGTEVPKGTIPISCVKEKSFFQLFLERAKAASHFGGRPVPVAIMTSPANHLETAAFLQSHQWFGSEPADLFIQRELPLCDRNGNWRLQSPGKIATGPNGNGECLELFAQAGILAKWKALGVCFVQVIQVDNALADPCSFSLVGFHAQRDLECSLLGIERDDASEAMGMIVSSSEKLKIREYSEWPQDLYQSRGADGNLVFSLANVGSFCFSLSFIERLKKKMPWHLADKQSLLWDPVEQRQKKIPVWKFETFLFDVLEESRSSSALVMPRNRCYAPLKQQTGPRSFATVKQALLEQDRIRYHEITGKSWDREIFELDPAFYYASSEQVQEWRQKKWPKKTYISPACL